MAQERQEQQGAQETRERQDTPERQDTREQQDTPERQDTQEKQARQTTQERHPPPGKQEQQGKQERQAKQQRQAKQEQRRKSMAAIGEWIATFPRRGIEVAASLVIVLATAAAVILALHVVFIVVKTSQDNGIVQFVNGVADALVWEFKDLFLLPKRPKTQVFVNFGLAAVVYLLLGRLAGGLLRRLS